MLPPCKLRTRRTKGENAGFIETAIALRCPKEVGECASPCESFRQLVWRSRNECRESPPTLASEPGYDPFSGSGTTLIAAERLGRPCLAMEIDPRYVDVCLRRWQAYTGLDAILLDDGRSFRQVEEERNGR